MEIGILTCYLTNISLSILFHWNVWKQV